MKKYIKTSYSLSNDSDVEFRRFTIDGKTFLERATPDNQIQVSRISPYDDTNYHFARYSDDHFEWRIISPKSHRAIKTIRDEFDNVSSEDIAEMLIEYDEAAHLEPRILHN